MACPAEEVGQGIAILAIWTSAEIVRGLTTAGSLWVVAAIGLVGSGLYLEATAATALILIILTVVSPLKKGSTSE